MNKVISNLILLILSSWILLISANNVRAETPTDEQLLELERQIEQQEAEQAEAKKRAELEAKRKAEDERIRAEEETRRQAEENARNQTEEAARQAEEQRRKDEEAARERAAEAARKIAVYIGLNVATSTIDYYGFTLESGRCLTENIEKALSAAFHMVKMVSTDKLSDAERSEVGFLLVADKPEFRDERKGLLTSLYELTNSFSLLTPDGNLIEHYTEKNSAEVTLASLSVTENVQTAKDAVCALTNNNLSSLLNKINSNARLRNP